MFNQEEGDCICSGCEGEVKEGSFKEEVEEEMNQTERKEQLESASSAVNYIHCQYDP